MSDSTDPLLPNAADMPPEDERLGASAAERVIALFGGIRPMATKLAVPVTTVQGWKKRGQIPPNRHEAIRAAAQAQGLALDAGLLAEAGRDKDVSEPAAVESSPPVAEPPQAPTDSAMAEPPVIPSTPPPIAEAPPPRPSAPPLPPMAAPPPALPRRGIGLAALSLLFAVAALAAVATRPFWEPRLADALGWTPTAAPIASDEVAALRSEIEALKRTPAPAAERTVDLSGFESRLATLEARPIDPAPDPALGPRLGAAEERLASMAAQLQGLAAALPPQIAAQRESLAQLTQQMFQTRLELQSLRREVQGNSLPQLQAQARALMLMQLRAAIQTPVPFAAELQSAVQQAAADPALQAVLMPSFTALEPVAARGAPTLAQLAAALPPLIREQARAAYDAPEARWWERLLARLSTVLSVRPGPGSGGDGSLAAALSQAEAALARDDLDAAIAAFAAQQSLPAPVEAWVARVRDRQTLNAALGPLGQGIVQALPRPVAPVGGVSPVGAAAPAPQAAPAAAAAPPAEPPAPAPAPRLDLPPMIGTPE
jgi:hypothetical protein